MINIKNMSVSFNKGRIVALDCLTLDLEPQKTTFIVGETGSGKSVLLSALLRILPCTASVTGQAVLNGKNLLALNKKEMQKIWGTDIAYIPQGNGNGMNPLMRIGLQIMEKQLDGGAMKRSEAYSAGIGLLRHFNIEEPEQVVHKFPHMLSGGMRQRALISMGIAMNTPIIFADEPTKGLDYDCISIIEDTFKKFDNKTILCVTHDLRFAKNVGDYICIMYGGQLVEISDVKSFFDNPLHPYSKALIAALPENGLKSTLGFAPSHTTALNGQCKFYDRCVHRREECTAAPPLVDVDGKKVRCFLYAN